MALLSMRKTLVESSFFARIDSLSSESIRSFKVAMLLLSVAGGALFSAARSVDFTQLLHRALFRRQGLLLPLHRRLLIVLPLADLREDPRFLGRLFEPLERAFDGLAFLHANSGHRFDLPSLRTTLRESSGYRPARAKIQGAEPFMLRRRADTGRAAQSELGDLARRAKTHRDARADPAAHEEHGTVHVEKAGEVLRAGPAPQEGGELVEVDLPAVGVAGENQRRAVVV